MLKKVLTSLVIIGFCLFGNLSADMNKELQTKCEKGDAKVCGEVGEQFYGKQEYVKAIKYFEIGCNKKDIISCAYLGDMYLQGLGVKKDDKKAEAYYERICSAKKFSQEITEYTMEIVANYQACINLATLRGHNLDMKNVFSTKETIGSIYSANKKFLKLNEKEYKEKLKKWKKAPKQNTPYERMDFIGMEFGLAEMAIISAAAILGNISIIVKDEQKAKKYYEESCKLGSKDSCKVYQMLSSPKENLPSFIRECENGDGLSCLVVAGLYLDGKDVEQDKKKAKEYYKKSCKLGQKSGCKQYEALKDNDGDINLILLHSYRAECDNEGFFGCYNVGSIYELGNRTIKKDLAKAKIYYKKSCDMGFDKGCEKLKALER